MLRWLLLLSLMLERLTVCTFADETASQSPQKSYGREELQKFVELNCLGCHDKATHKGGLALEEQLGAGVEGQSELWEKVIRKLRARQMPPPGSPRPEEREYAAAIAWLETSLDDDAAKHPHPGRTDTLRRLNRTEYQNTIRDLLALDVDVSALLPADESSHGFDNVTVTDLSPTLLNRYVSAAQKISRLAVGRGLRSPAGEKIGRAHV